MKKIINGILIFFAKLFGIVIMSISLVLSCIGCTSNVYTCEVYADEIEISVSNNTARTIQIGQSTYNTQHTSSKKSSLTNDIIDYFETVEGARIRIDSKNDEIIGFTNITPYPVIDNIDSMSDEEIKSTVESLMGDLADFTQYNEFSLTRGQAKYHLEWQVKRQLLCNIKVIVDISLDGSIDWFSKTNACPDELTKSFISVKERDAFIENEICSHLNVNLLDGIEYEIRSEVLSYYQNKPAIIYTVKIVEDGFSELIVLVIY